MQPAAAAAAAAAFCTARGDVQRGRSDGGESGKLSGADGPRRQTTAASYALAAISAVGNDPSQIRVRLFGSRISETHFPHVRIRTPLYTLVLIGEFALAFLRVYFPLVDCFEMAEGDFTGNNKLAPFFGRRGCGFALSTIGLVPSEFPTSSISLLR